MQHFQLVLELLRKESINNLSISLFEDNPATEINLETFYFRLTTELGLELDANNVKQLFYQLDPYCKGCIKLSNLVQYIEDYEKLFYSKDDDVFHSKPTMYPGVKSQDNIFEWTIYTELDDSDNEISRQYYLSLSHNGLLTFWRHDMRKHFEKQITVLDSEANTSKMATGLACIPRYKLIAVSTASGDIRFFTTSFFKFELKLFISWLPSIVMCLDCYDSQKLICGDFTGAVYSINMDEIFFRKLFSRADHLGPQEIVFDSLKKTEVIGLSFKCMEKVHYAPVVKVKYIPCIRAIISCSVSTKRAMLIHFLDCNESLNFSSEGGITCFDFCQRLNCVVTGGIDHTIKIWNTTKNSSCNETLNGHFSSVTHVVVDDDRLFIISADREKTVRVWDMLRPTCLQTIKIKESDFSKKKNFTSLFMDSKAGKLIITTNRIAVLNIVEPVHRTSAHPGSNSILLAEYSNAFDCIVTVGNDSTVAVWDAKSKSLINEFRDIHFTMDKLGFTKRANVTAAGLDPSGRRLITAALSFVGFEIFVGGLSGMITSLCDDGESEVNDSEWRITHDQSVSSMSCYGDNIIATASSDGETIIWFWKNADVKLRMKDSSEGLKQEDNQFVKSITEDHRCSINQIIFLQRRKMEQNVGNLVSCENDGRIRFWSVICTNKQNQCQLLSRFQSISNLSDSILCLETDSSNTILLTGDTLGYVRTYDIEDYYSSFDSLPSTAHESKHRESFYPFLRMKRLIEKNPLLCSKFESEGGAELGYAPLLLNCYRAHIEPIQRISYCNERTTVITAGRKGSIRLWKLSGTYIGELGINNEISRPLKSCSGNYCIPKDIRAVASALTLQVLNNGRKPHWELGMKAIRRCRLFQISGKPKALPLEWMVKKDTKQKHSPLQDFDLHYEISKRLREKEEKTQFEENSKSYDWLSWQTSSNPTKR